MNPFEQFLQLKQQIETDLELMEKLGRYASVYDVRGAMGILPYIGGGTSSVHFRLGRVGDLWLATRENSNMVSEDLRTDCEISIGMLVKHHCLGDAVPRICGGVKTSDAWTRYFLIVEDLTHGGSSDFQPAKCRENYGYLNGEKIYHDPDSDDTDRQFYFFEGLYRYMSDDAMIVLK